jgi:CspA family cold shock protein
MDAHPPPRGSFSNRRQHAGLDEAFEAIFGDRSRDLFVRFALPQTFLVSFRLVLVMFFDTGVLRMPQGVIKKLVADKGFGFIAGERGDLFFHSSSVQGTTFDALKEGQTVEYTEGRGPKGPRAETVTVA